MSQYEDPGLPWMQRRGKLVGTEGSCVSISGTVSYGASVKCPSCQQ